MILKDTRVKKIDTQAFFLRVKALTAEQADSSKSNKSKSSTALSHRTEHYILSLSLSFIVAPPRVSAAREILAENFFSISKLTPLVALLQKTPYLRLSEKAAS